MRKHLTRTGNSLALVLDRPLLEAVGLDADTPVEVSTNVMGVAAGRIGKAEAAVFIRAHQRPGP